MDGWLIWLIIAVCLLIIEVFSQMLWAICLAAGCIAALVASLCGVDGIWQVVIMAVTGIVVFLAALPWFRNVQNRRSAKSARTGMDALIGRRAIVTHEIKPGQTGRARIDGDYWQVVAPAAKETIEKGEEVVVTQYDSIILTVVKA